MIEKQAFPPLGLPAAYLALGPVQYLRRSGRDLSTPLAMPARAASTTPSDTALRHPAVDITRR
jgi:hypothetical protein